MQVLKLLNYLKNMELDLELQKLLMPGGVAVSALEMSQNSLRYQWSEEEVDSKLHDIMKDIYKKI